MLRSVSQILRQMSNEPESNKGHRFLLSLYSSNVVAHLRAGNMQGAEAALKLAEKEQVRLRSAYLGIMTE